MWYEWVMLATQLILTHAWRYKLTSSILDLMLIINEVLNGLIFRIYHIMYAHALISIRQGVVDHIFMIHMFSSHGK